MITYLLYPILLISKLCKKNFSSVGKILKLTGNTILNRITKNVSIEEFSLKMVNKIFINNKKIKILVDDSLIKKFFSNKIEGTSFLYDHVLKIFGKFICFDGKNTVPLKFKICTSKDLDPEGYLNKNEIFRNIVIEAVNTKISNHVIADGFFANEKNLNFLSKKNIHFDMRFPCNRRITVEGEDKKVRVDEFFNFKFKKNYLKCKTIKCKYKDTILYITKAFKINKKGQRLEFFIISNYHNNNPKEHLDAYNLRWNIEKFFRTTKQYLGLGDCQSTKIKNQNAHINSVFISYILIEYIRKIKNYKCPEDVINKICYKNPSDLISYFKRFDHIFNELKF